MTIKDLENRTGMDRATIRFYEKEGLIAPQRQSNGYRDYSEEDLLTLEKIALLRRLDLPLEDIRAVQKGEVPLCMALERQHQNLLARQNETARALQVSLAIQRERESYHTLQPEKYKAQLPPPIPEYRLPRPEIPAAESAAGHPWLRYFARGLDMSVYGTISAAVIMLLGISPVSGVFSLLNTILTMGVLIGLEPLLLSTWGYTPGKWILGLRLRDSKGGKLDYTDGICRTALLLCHGMGLSIPLVNLWCYWKSYRRTQTMETVPPVPPQDQPWDDMTEYTVEERPWHSYLLYCLARAAEVGLLAGLVLLAAQPNLWGRPLTPAQYAKNVNHVLDYGIEKNQFTFYEDGHWTADFVMAFATGTDPDDFQQDIVLQGGLVNEVSMTYPIHSGTDDATQGDGEIYKISTVFGLLERSNNKKQKAQLDQLFQAGEGAVYLDDWVITQTILNKPADFAQTFKWNNGVWHFRGEHIETERIPYIQFTVKRR